MTRGVATIVIAAMLMSGCAATSTNGDRAASPSSRNSMQPSTAAALSGPRSQVVKNLVMPPGAVPGVSYTYWESWTVPGKSRSDLLAYLAQQLPISKDYDGLPWCKTITLPTETRWVWGSPDNQTAGLYIRVTDDPKDPESGEVYIMNGSDAAANADECVQ
jgi:hypothetical protein